jgi:hypothetical protein
MYASSVRTLRCRVLPHRALVAPRLDQLLMRWRGAHASCALSGCGWWTNRCPVTWSSGSCSYRVGRRRPPGRCSLPGSGPPGRADHHRGDASGQLVELSVHRDCHRAYFRRSFSVKRHSSSAGGPVGESAHGAIRSAQPLPAPQRPDQAIDRRSCRRFRHPSDRAWRLATERSIARKDEGRDPLQDRPAGAVAYSDRRPELGIALLLRHRLITDPAGSTRQPGRRSWQPLGSRAP